MARVSQQEKQAKKDLRAEQKKAQKELRAEQKTIQKEQRAIKRQENKERAQIRGEVMRNKADEFSRIEKRHFAGKDIDGGYTPAVNVLTKINRFVPLACFVLTIILSLIFPAIVSAISGLCLASGIVCGIQAVDKFLSKNAPPAEEGLAKYLAIAEIAVANALVVPAKLVVKAAVKISERIKEKKDKRAEKKTLQNSEIEEQVEKIRTEQLDEMVTGDYVNQLENEGIEQTKMAKKKKLFNGLKKKSKTSEEKVELEKVTPIIEDEQANVL